jgi:hypothetical protein
MKLLQLIDTQQPKYITYKGAKYQKIDTLSEITVEPGNQCCIIEYSLTRGELNVISVKFVLGNPGKIAQDFLDELKEEAIADGDQPPYMGGFLDEVPTEYDKFSYDAQIHEEGFMIVCTKNKGRWGHLYDLVKAYDATGEGTAAWETAYSALRDAVDFDLT